MQIHVARTVEGICTSAALISDGPLPSVLQEVSVPVINNSVCETMYRSAGYIEHIPEIFICAGWRKGGFDSCEVRKVECMIREKVTLLSCRFSERNCKAIQIYYAILRQEDQLYSLF